MIASATCLVGAVIWLAMVVSSATDTVTAVEERAATREPAPTADPSASRRPVTELSKLNQVAHLTTDLGTDSTEFSGITVNHDLDRLLIVDDEDLLFEFDRAPDGTPITPPRRTLEIRAGAGDIEGIAWLEGMTYVLAHETDGRLTVVTIDEDATQITDADVSRSVDTGIRGDNGKGLEGVAYLDANSRAATNVEFIVVEERPATLRLIDVDGRVVSTLSLELSDASDVWAISPDRVIVLSDEDRMIIDLEIERNGAVTVIDRLSLELPDGRFEQPEGIVGTHNPDRLYIVGEAPGPGRYSFGLWQAP